MIAKYKNGNVIEYQTMDEILENVLGETHRGIPIEVVDGDTVYNAPAMQLKYMISIRNSKR